ncbi:hypothetical protein [Syntrophomonas palmitatica]|uniref:hypothetical protein n=1 Tax=Syntrophomonas palmitatica TaxID=402877 RepID=UPI000A8E8D78|nr:hypothetical protein [Syntrophomonas palmitatica]
MTDLRLKPRDESLRKIIELLENLLQSGEDNHEALNLGRVMRLLCAPPYGCNIASAGLILALFVGKRRNNLNLLRESQVVSIDVWLSDALQGNFLNLRILDSTDLVLVSQETISEWEKLLEDWDSEDTYSGKVAFHDKALKLQSKIPIPQLLYYKYENLASKARAAQAAINEYNNKLDDATSKIHNGSERDKLNILAWGTVILKDLLSLMESEAYKWTSAQLEIVQKNLADARLKTQEMFPNWYKHQTVRTIEQLGDFKRQMISVERNLTSLGLDDEQKLLAEYVEEIERNVRFIDELRKTVNNIKQMSINNVVNDSTTIQTLNSWLEQVQTYVKQLDEARLRTDIVDRDIADAKSILARFQKGCLDQVERNKERLGKVYEIEEIDSLGQITAWKQEVNILIKIFESDKDNEDLVLVQKQLDLLERHFHVLDDSELDDKEFLRLLHQCEQETLEQFDGDDPPLDNDAIYASISKSLQGKRSSLAKIWMEAHLPELKDIKEYDAAKALQTIASLQKRPKLLSNDQVKEVKKMIVACEIRIDELEVDGLLAKFDKLSDRNKKAFINKIENQIRAYLNSIA